VVIGTVPLLRAEGDEKEPQVGLVAPEDGSPPNAEAMILPLTPDKAELRPTVTEALTLAAW